MKFLFVFTHYNFWAPMDPIAREFIRNGHEVRVLIDRVPNRKFAKRFPMFVRSEQPYSMEWSLGRSDGLQFIMNPLRELISYIAYLKLRIPTSHLLVDRWAAYVPFFLRPLTRDQKGRELLSRDSFWEKLRIVERKIPADWRIKRQLRKYQPDALIAASAILPYSKETEYLKAAEELGIPTILIVPSWDNLTTKGTLHVVPDHVFVWNQGQVSEAEKLHNIPTDRVFCTGAPKFDLWFDIRPTLDRLKFCEKIGLDSEKPYLLYLCSSEFISGDEVVFVKEVAEKIKQDPRLRNMTLLVRPHPQNLTPWKAVRQDDCDFLIWPKDQTSLAPQDMIQEYFHSLLYSTGVVGINTSAFIEAAIVDKPCIAITSKQYANTQLSIPHFRHLLDAGFLILSADLDEFSDAVAELSNGKDAKKMERRKFIRDFVRPHGLTFRAIDVMAKAIENVARGREPGFETNTISTRTDETQALPS